MKRRLAVLVLAVLTAAGVSACGKDHANKANTAGPVLAPLPAGSAQPPAGGAGGPSGAIPTGNGAPAASGPADAPNATGSPGAPGVPGKAPKVRHIEPGKTVSSFGIGPYEIGASQTTLRKAKLIGAVTVRNGCGTAFGATRFQKPALTFKAGRLQRITLTGKSVFTVGDAKIGTRYADLKTIYPTGKELSDYNGASGWLVTEGANALLFRISDGKVTTIVAGEADPVQVNFTDNQPC